MTKGWMGATLALLAIALGGCETTGAGGLGHATIVNATPAGPAETAVRFAQARASEVEPRIHSIIALDPTAVAQARTIDASGRTGPLVGKPVLIKDNIETLGPLPTTAGSLALKDNVTGRDAPLVARLRGACAVMLGKTNLSEWANIRDGKSISGWSAIGGQTRNPYALDRNTCGSSSGSAAAVAAGIVNYAVGTETDGSITCPASINGIVGLKPTVGLVSRTHIVPISASQDTAGPMTRTVRQAAELLTAMAGSDPADKSTIEADRRKVDYSATLNADSLRGKRIGVMRFASGFGTDEPFNRALALLRARGAILVEIKSFNDKAIGNNEFSVLMTELKAGMNAYLATTPAAVRTRTLADLIAFNRANSQQEMALFKQELFELAQSKRGLDDPAYKRARRISFAAAGPNGIDRLLRTYRLSALVGPTMPPAWKIDAIHGDQIDGGGAGSLAAVAGYPHLTVPMGQVRGLPVGLSFIGPKWSEASILSLGYAYEQARGALPGPRFLASIESAPETAPLFEPARR